MFGAGSSKGIWDVIVGLVLLPIATVTWEIISLLPSGCWGLNL